MKGNEGSVAVLEKPTKLILEKHYQVPVDTTDVEGMVSAVMGRLPWLKTLAVLHGKRLQRGGLPNTEFSLRNFDLRRFNEDENEKGIKRPNVPVFEPTLGSITLSGGVQNSQLAGFFTKDRVYVRDDGNTELRGANYFVAHAKTMESPLEKVAVLRNDLSDGLEVISGFVRDSIKTESDYLSYLGVLDYLKNQSITVFNALTYPERRLNGIYSDDNSADTNFQLREYQELRQQAIELMKRFTRMYYQSCLGLPYDSGFDPKVLQESIDNLTGYLKLNIKEKEFYKFTYPEVNHPLVIMLGVQETALRNPNVDTIIGIPTGGVESAIAAQMAYELICKKSPGVIFIPVSIHRSYRSGVPLEQEDVDRMVKPYSGLIKDKNILIIDDNANSGRTLQMVSDAVASAGALSERALLIEHDPSRILKRKGKPSVIEVFRMNHENAESTMGKVKISDNGSEKYSDLIQQRLKPKQI